MTNPSRTQVNLRVSSAVVEDLDALAEHEHLTRIDVARQILLDGIAARKRRMALQLYASGKVSKSRAAAMAGLTLWEWHDLLAEAQSRDSLSASDVLSEVRRIIDAVGQR